MDIVHVSPEFAPLVKAGGLGDVVFSLSRELSLEGHTCSVILPYYSFIDESKLEDFCKDEAILTTPEGNSLISWNVYHGTYESVSVFLLKPNPPREYFERKAIYGEEDDIARFILFSCAAALLIEEFFQESVVHLHDWPTALVAPLLFEEFPIVYTIHNFAYQGQCTHYDLERVHADRFASSLTMRHSDNPILMKAGIEFSGAITTVSPTYAEEILTPQFGCGLESLIAYHSPKLQGILNGLDLEYWNPEFDPRITAHYSLTADDLFEQKAKNKKALFDHFGKPYIDAPLLCCITRLVPQKGPDLIEAGLQYALAKGCSFALSGVPCEVTEKQFSSVEKEYAQNDQALLFFGFDEALAHLIYAAADYILIPSNFEPCGLTQMIALMYGTIPIVTATGGLKDTITDIAFSDGNGILLPNHTKEAVEEGIERALDIPIDVRKSLFSSLNKEQFSWNNSVSKYIAIYESFVSAEPL